MKLTDETVIYHASAWRCNSSETLQVHLEKECYYLQASVNVHGPKRYGVCPDGWELCDRCNPDEEIRGGGGVEANALNRFLSQDDVTVDDVPELTDKGERYES